MKQRLKKLCGTFLALTMLLTLLPVTAYASYSSVILSGSSNFGTASVDYADRMPEIFSLFFVDVTSPITGLSASLGNGDNSAFEITTPLSLSDTINNSAVATISIRPKTGLAVGIYTDTLTISADGNPNVINTELSFTVSADSYICTVSPPSATFASDYQGYDNAAMAQTFTVSNTGTGELTGLAASLPGGASSSFEISTALSSDSIAPGETATVSVRPKTGLWAHTYTGTLQITGDNGAAASVSLSFTVRSNPYLISPPSNQSVSAGGTTSFAVSADGDPSPSYQWVESSNGSNWFPLSDGGIYSGTATNILTLTGVTTANNGYQYCCVVSNNNGSFDTLFAKLTVTGSDPVSVGTIDIGGQSGVSLANSVDQLALSGWKWDVDAATLTLGENYGGEGISIQSNSDINLVLTGDVRIHTFLHAIDLGGINSNDTNRRLIIKAGSHTLSLTSDIFDAVNVNGNITIESGTVVAKGDSHGISTTGDVTVNGNASLTTTGGDMGSGIQSDGNILINTTGTVQATGQFCGLRPVNGGITISSGTVNANGGMYEALHGGNNNAGVNITGGTVVTGGANGNVSGSLTVSGTGTNVTVNGSITDSGSLTVSGGTVTVTGTVAGSQNVTGGTVWVNGAKVYPVGSGNDGGSNGGSGGGASSTPTPTASGSTATTTVTPTVKNGAATASVPASQVTSALEQAQKAAKASGETPKVEIKLANTSGISSVAATIPQASVNSLVSGNVGGLTVTSGIGSVSFDAAALTTISGASSGDVTVSVARVDAATLPAAVQSLVGSRPVYEFSVTGGGKTISQLGGAATVSVPYTLGAGEDPNAVIVSYLNASGNLETVLSGRYDAASGTVTFTTTHFSKYAVGYNKVTFADVSDSAWYADAVTYLAARGVTGGTTDTTFTPDATLTRGQFITLLLKAYGIEAIDGTADNFADAGSTYYTGYLAAAKQLGITSGVGNNNFAPTQTISRQQMFTLLYNALNALGQLPEGDSGKTVSDFADSGSVAPYAQKAMDYLVEAGVVGGKNGYLLPQNSSTRAQMAQVLYNLLRR